MSVNCKLPSKLEWKLFGGDAEAYKTALYKVFKRDFIENELLFRDKKVDIIHEQYFEGKERSFWHIISSGDEDVDRSLDTERCSSLPYAAALIKDKEDCQYYRVWVKWNDKSKRDRYYIWCTKVNYIVVLEDRQTHYKLITAFNLLPYKLKAYEKMYNKYLVETKTPIS